MSVYKRGGKYWYSFVFDGRHIQETTRQSNRKAAIDMESARRTALAKGEVGLVDRPRYTVNELLDRLWTRYQLDHKASPQNASLLKRTRAGFGAKWADELTAEHCHTYALKRRETGAADASINRVFQQLRAAYNLAGVPFPKFELLPEDNVRQGFFEPAEMDAVIAHLPDDGLADFVRFCYTVGMRKGEASKLRWGFVQGNQIIVPGEYCKSRKDHVIPIAGPLVEIMERRKAAKGFRTNGTTQLSEYIFHRGDGQPVYEFRKSWRTALEAAGLFGRVFHDTRRCAVRDLTRAGVPQSVAMSITGHKTISTFLRYNITSDADTRAALEKTAQYRAG